MDARAAPLFEGEAIDVVEINLTPDTTTSSQQDNQPGPNGYDPASIWIENEPQRQSEDHSSGPLSEESMPVELLGIGIQFDHIGDDIQTALLSLDHRLILEQLDRDLEEDILTDEPVLSSSSWDGPPASPIAASHLTLNGTSIQDNSNGTISSDSGNDKHESPPRPSVPAKRLWAPDEHLPPPRNSQPDFDDRWVQFHRRTLRTEKPPIEDEPPPRRSRRPVIGAGISASAASLLWLDPRKRRRTSDQPTDTVETPEPEPDLESIVPLIIPLTPPNDEYQDESRDTEDSDCDSYVSGDSLLAERDLGDFGDDIRVFAESAHLQHDAGYSTSESDVGNPQSADLMEIERPSQSTSSASNRGVSPLTGGIEFLSSDDFWLRNLVTMDMIEENEKNLESPNERQEGDLFPTELLEADWDRDSVQRSIQRSGDSMIGALDVQYHEQFLPMDRWLREDDDHPLWDTRSSKAELDQISIKDLFAEVGDFKTPDGDEDISQDPLAQELNELLQSFSSKLDKPLSLNPVLYEHLWDTGDIAHDVNFLDAFPTSGTQTFDATDNWLIPFTDFKLYDEGEVIDNLDLADLFFREDDENNNNFSNLQPWYPNLQFNPELPSLTVMNYDDQNEGDAKETKNPPNKKDISDTNINSSSLELDEETELEYSLPPPPTLEEKQQYPQTPETFIAFPATQRSQQSSSSPSSGKQAGQHICTHCPESFPRACDLRYSPTPFHSFIPSTYPIQDFNTILITALDSTSNTTVNHTPAPWTAVRSLSAANRSWRDIRGVDGMVRCLGRRGGNVKFVGGCIRGRSS